MKKEVKKLEHVKYQNTDKKKVDIICPFCNKQVTAFIWSLAGSGKKCLCGAIHSNYGYSTLTNNNQ